MAVVEDLTEEEKYLLALLLDQSGIDLAEFVWRDQTTYDGLFRCWDFQNGWYRNESKFQVDQAGRALGKSLGIQMRSFAFAFANPGEELLITAPEMIHLEPVTQAVERRLMDSRISQEMLKRQGTSQGITHRPFEARFVNGARIIGRIPQKDGRGVKGSCGAGTYITCIDGHRPIEDIEPGDLVLTHRGGFQPVLTVHAYEADTVRVVGAGHRGLVVSANHRFYGRRNSNPQRTRNLGIPTWVAAYDEELPERWYWASPRSLPVVEAPQLPSDVMDARSFLWLCGAYVADGCLGGKNKRGARTFVELIDSAADLVSVKLMAGLAGYDPHDPPHSNASCLRIYSTELTRFLREQFGHRAEGKRLPMWLLGASKIMRDAFLEGYLHGDGHWLEDRRRWEVSTASKALAMGVKLLAQGLDYTVGYSWVDPRPNRLAPQPQRAHRLQLKGDGRGIFDDDHVWQRVRGVETAGVARVYDLVVAGDGSYVADGLVHKGGSA